VAHDFATLAQHIGISTRHLYRILNEGSRPSVAVLGRLAAAMDVTMDELLNTIDGAADVQLRKRAGRGKRRRVSN
jgi:transcriptional regulator with XRE-family HTH domain